METLEGLETLTGSAFCLSGDLLENLQKENKAFAAENKALRSQIEKQDYDALEQKTKQLEAEKEALRSQLLQEKASNQHLEQENETLRGQLASVGSDVTQNMLKFLAYCSWNTSASSAASVLRWAKSQGVDVSDKEMRQATKTLESWKAGGAAIGTI